MSPQRKDKRPPMVVAMRRASEVSSVSFELVIPTVVGLWIDHQYGTGPWLLIVGAALGAYVAFSHLMQLAKPPQASGGRSQAGISNGAQAPRDTEDKVE